MTSDVCRSCETSIYRTFGAEEEVRPSVEPTKAALWGLLPGGGHFKLAEAGLGMAVAGLILSSLLFGVLMVSGNRRSLGIALLLIAVVAWAISIYDATRFAANNEDAVLLRPRVVTVAMGVVFAIVIVAAVSITGEEPIP